MAKQQRKFIALPFTIIAVFLLLLLLQITFHEFLKNQQTKSEALPLPPTLSVLKVFALGDPSSFARVLMLWLQSFDNQPGISIPFKELNYDAVEAWLNRIIDLDPTGQYPLLAASRLYAEVDVESKQRQMLELVAKRYTEDPARRWPWLAHAVVVAKHRINDIELSLKYARILSATKGVEGIPSWAQQMEVFILEDMGELETAQILIGGLLSSGAITDPHELHFLKERLERLENSKN